MNIRSLPKHKGELVAYLSNLPLFDILVLTEIGARNIDLTANLLTGYDFLYVLPDKNTHGGVGIYWRDRLTNWPLVKWILPKLVTAQDVKLNLWW